MFRITRAAAVAAVLGSVIALTDAVTVATAGHGSLFTEGPGWGLQVAAAVHGALYALLATSLITQGAGIDAGSRGRRWTRRVLVLLFTLLAVPFLVGVAVPVEDMPQVVTAVTGTSFLLSFPVAAALGLTLLRRADVRLPAVLLTSILGGLVLVVGLGVAGSPWAHPAYVEVPQFLGVALLCERLAGASHTDVQAAAPSPATA